MVRDLRAADPARSPRRRPLAQAAGGPCLGPFGRPSPLRRGGRAHPRADRGRGGLPGEPHASASGAGRRGPHPALPPPVPCPAEPLLGLPRHRRPPVLSASPELFLQIESDRILVRPMKGTAPRGRWPAEDRRAAQALLASDKDRAENAMIVDLLRNDLGRVARPGTVEVTRLFEVERYETVWQLTSTIAARLSRGLSLLDVFRALFPSGSVTGAPKLAAMRIIADLEDSPRGVYTGAVGFVAPAPTGGVRAAFNVAIRTLILETATGLA